jgi:hypothetical protein
MEATANGLPASAGRTLRSLSPRTDSEAEPPPQPSGCGADPPDRSRGPKDPKGGRTGGGMTRARQRSSRGKRGPRRGNKPMGETVGSTSGHGGASIPDSSADEGLEAWPSPRGTEPYLNVRPPTSGRGQLAPRSSDREVQRRNPPTTPSKDRRHQRTGARAEPRPRRRKPDRPRIPPDQPEGRPPRNHLVGASRLAALQLATPREWTS